MLKKFIHIIWYSSLSSIYHKVFKRKTIIESQPIEKNIWSIVSYGFGKGLHLFLNPTLYTGWQEMIDGVYDSFLFKEIESLEPKNCIWDIGAHFGFSSLVFSQLTNENGIVYSFEPNKENITRFKKHLEKNPTESKKIKLFEIAVSDKDGSIEFRESKNVDNSTSSGSHISAVIPPEEKSVYDRYNFTYTKVKTNTVDTLLNEGLKSPDIVKIDVEGAEYQVLKGAEKLIKTNKPIFFIEVHNITAMYDVITFLYSYNYKIDILDRENAYLSRCFIIAKPNLFR